MLMAESVSVEWVCSSSTPATKPVINGRAHLILPDALQPFLGRCARAGDFGDVADCIFMDVGIDGLRSLSVAAIENGCRRHDRDPFVTRV